MRKVTYLTKNGYEKLRKKLEYLQSVERSNISKRISVAREHGDLKENFEYTAAKEALTQVMLKIQNIIITLSSAEIIDNINISSDKIYIGATVSVKNIDNDEIDEYTLVSVDEIDPSQNKISIDSPISKGLLGHSIGNTVEIKIPAGIIKYKILNISR